MQDEVGHVLNPSLRPWHRPMTLYVNNKIDNKAGFLNKICVNYNISISFHFILLKSWLFPVKICISFRGVSPPDLHIGSRSRARHKVVAPPPPLL